jgi:hypothetical protein
MGTPSVQLGGIEEDANVLHSHGEVETSELMNDQGGIC